jgi:hypothetical protein
MSIKYLNDAWLMPGINAQEKILLLAIADCSNDDGYAYPGYDKLLKKTSIGSKSTLSKCMKVLKGVGILNSESHGYIGNGKKVNTYTISLRCELSISTDRELIEKIKELRKSCSNAISTDGVQRKIQHVYPISTGGVHEPSLQPPESKPSVLKDIAKTEKPKAEKKPKKKPNSMLSFLLDYGIEGDLAEDFIIHRRSKRAAITATALQGFEREAQIAGISLIMAVTTCIERNWQGFKAEWYMSAGLSNNTQSAGKTQPYLKGGLNQPIYEYKPSQSKLDQMQTIEGERVYD